MTATLPHTPAPASPPSGRGRSPARRVGLVVAVPVLIAAVCVAALFGAAGNPPCQSTVTSPGGPAPAGMFAAPLQLSPGEWYRVGATEYGGPDDPTSGEYGSSGAYLPDHPDGFAELSLLDTNPANGDQPFTVQDANALSNLPYGTTLRVRNAGHELVLAKLDTGYGQGPGQTIPYRLDVWWQAAAQLGISKTPVDIQLAPATGSGGLLNQTHPATTTPPPMSSTTTACASPTSPGGPLPITPGQTAQINPITGIASAPADAPAAVKRAIAAANQIIDTPYIWGGGHSDLNARAEGYDCSGASAYVLHQAGLYLPATGPTSASFEHYYPAGPGRWITVYANSIHMWLDIEGIVLNTAWYGPVTPTTPGSGPRWQAGSTAQAQINGNAAAGNPPFSVTHPQGL